MEKRRTSWNILVSRAWIPTLILVVAVLVWQIFRVLPGWLELKISQTLSEEGVVVTSFPVEHIGYKQTKIGEGSLLYQEEALSWESIHINYQFKELLEGRITHVDVKGPVLSVQVKLPVKKADQIHSEDIQVPENIGKMETVREEVLPGMIDTTAIDVLSDDFVPLEEEMASEEEPEFSLWQFLQDLPLESLGARDGVLEIQLQEENQFTAQISGLLERQPFGVSGEAMLKNEEVSMHISLRAPAGDRVVTLQAESAMPVSAFRDLGNRFRDQLENCDDYPSITSSGQFVMDVFAEQSESQPIFGSAEASMDELTFLIPGTDTEVGLDELVVAGVFKESSLNLEGGTEVLLPMDANVIVEPFGLRFSLKDSNHLTLETEIIDWSSSGFAGRCAVLGKGDLRRFPEKGWGRVETSFSLFQYGAISLDPFSILVTPSEKDLSIEASPIGLNQSGTIWVEELTGEWDLEEERGHSQFSWYGLLGEALGTGKVAISTSTDSTQTEFTLLDATALENISGEIVQSGEQLSTNLSGQLHLPWINTIAKWFGNDSYTLGGVSPDFEMRLKWQFPLLTGGGKLLMSGVDLSMADGVEIQGISGPIDFAVMVMPRTLGKQTTHIEKITSGPIKMRDIEIEWELKNIRELSVTKLIGRIEDGQVEFDPFTVDPLNPIVETSIRIKQFNADLLRQWLDEKRFSIEGSISGKIPVGWKDGELVIGSGNFELDTQMESGLLKFEDESFLREKFDSLGGVPIELKERLLSALWEKGIQVNGMEIYLGPTGNEEELSFRIAVNGETGNDLLEFPIGGFVINNLISVEDLALLMNMLAPIRVDPDLGRD